jgi:hypothetical protein
MTEITTVSTVITSIKTATEIVKALRQVDISLDKAETKLKLADLMDSLADARIKAAEIQEVVRTKDQRIAELESALAIKANVCRHGDAYYEIDSNGKPTGDPHCSHCWEVNHKLLHIHETNSTYSHCSACNTSFRRNRVPYLHKQDQAE